MSPDSLCFLTTDTRSRSFAFPPSLCSLNVACSTKKHHPVALQVAAVAKLCHCDDVIDSLLTTLAQFTYAADPSAPYAHAVVAFGSSLLAREATVTMFDIASAYADKLRTGWGTVLDCIMRLHKIRLVEVAVFVDAQVQLFSLNTHFTKHVGIMIMQFERPFSFRKHPRRCAQDASTSFL
jgi:hypothetical protein